jgi:hypothetical protein
MTDREGLFSKGRNPNSSQPVACPLTFKYSFCQAGKRKKTLAVLCLSFRTLKCYVLRNLPLAFRIIKGDCHGREGFPSAVLRLM